MKKKVVKKDVPSRNYLYLLLIVFGVVVLTFYINAWAKTYRTKKLETSPMEGVVEKLNINELGMSVSEMNEVLLYFGYTNNEKIYEMEKRIISFAKREDIISKMIYVDVTEKKSNNQYLKDVKEVFSDFDDKVEAPFILYIKNGKIVDYVKPEYGLVQTYQIKKLIDEYNLSN